MKNNGLVWAEHLSTGHQWNKTVPDLTGGSFMSKIYTFYYKLFQLIEDS